MTEEEITALQETNKALTTRVNQLESINTDLVEQRADLKQKIADGSTDEELKAELANYKAQLSTVEADRTEIENNFKADIASLNMINELKASGVLAHNDDALKAISQMALQDAKFDDGAFVYLNEDGTTRFNDEQKPYSVIDKVNELKGGDKSYFFKEPQGGGGAGDKPDIAPKTDINSVLDAGLTY